MPRVSDDHLAARRQQIVSAALRCFARDGFHATSVRDVVRESGLSAGAVYSYFPSKEELVAAAVEPILDQLTAALDDALGAAEPPAPTAVKTPVAIGSGGAVSTVDFDASRAGLEILRSGGNAADAAVAAAAALGVTEPFSAGLGGGGYFVYYDARTHRVSTVDGRETAAVSAA